MDEAITFMGSHFSLFYTGILFAVVKNNRTVNLSTC